MNAQPEPDEFCPRCGHWVTHTRVDTGWCEPCSVEEDRFGQVCIRCSTPRPASHYGKPGSTKGSSHRGKVCRSCRTAVRRLWRQAHPEQEAATERRRRDRYGYGCCPVCEHSKPLTATGRLRQHQPHGGAWIIGESPCVGSGREPEKPLENGRIGPASANSPALVATSVERQP